MNAKAYAVMTAGLVATLVMGAYNTDPPPCPWYGAQWDGYRCLQDDTPLPFDQYETVFIGLAITGWGTLAASRIGLKPPRVRKRHGY